MRTGLDARYLSLVDAMPSGVVVVCEQRIVFANQALAELLGAATPQALTGRSPWGFIGADDLAAVREAYDRLLDEAPGGAGRLERRTIVRVDGTLVPVELSATHFEWHDKPAVQAILRDLTAHRTVEEALRESEALRAQILHAMPGGIVEVRADGSILSANHEACRILGLSWDELSQRYTMDFEPETVWEDGSPCPHDKYPVTRALVTGEAQAPVTIGVRRTDGETSWAIFTAVPVRDRDEQVSGAVVTLLDVTPRKRAEEDADERAHQHNVVSELGLRALVEDDLDALMAQAVERVGQTLRVSGCAVVQRVAERGPVIRARQGRFDDLDANELAGLMEPANTPLPEGFANIGSEELVPAWILESSGVERWPTGEVRIASRLTAVIHGRDRPWGLLFAVSQGPRDFRRDDQGFMNAVAGLLAAAVDRRRVEQQRAELEAQLRQQQRLDSLGTLAGGVAHEINNPIQGIMSYAELIRASAPSDGRLRAWAEEIVQGTERIAVIVRNLLAFARPEAAGRQPVVVRELVNKTLSLVRTVLRKDQIGLEVDLPDHLPAVECQGQQIQQVLMNLIVNARDALNARYLGANDEKRVRISAHALERVHETWVRLSVEDFGVGIPSEQLERIFDPFFTTKRQDRGTGLGLSVSHGIVTEHGGRLWAESRLGQFTRFHLELPVRSAHRRRAR